MKRTILSILSGLFIVWLFYAAGYDFDTRGEVAFWASLFPVFVGTMVYCLWPIF